MEETVVTEWNSEQFVCCIELLYMPVFPGKESIFLARKALKKWQKMWILEIVTVF